MHNQKILIVAGCFCLRSVFCRFFEKISVFLLTFDVRKRFLSEFAREQSKKSDSSYLDFFVKIWTTIRKFWQQSEKSDSTRKQLKQSENSDNNQKILTTIKKFWQQSENSDNNQKILTTIRKFWQQSENSDNNQKILTTIRNLQQQLQQSEKIETK